MPFDYAQESIRQAHYERNQQLTVRPEPVEGLIQSFLEDRKSSDKATQEQLPWRIKIRKKTVSIRSCY
jgi:hypothetical protein